jgi:hypothetical protein
VETAISRLPAALSGTMDNGIHAKYRVNMETDRDVDLQRVQSLYRIHSRRPGISASIVGCDSQAITQSIRIDSKMKALLSFDNMLTPKIITIVYWLLLLLAVVGGIGSMFSGYGGFSFGGFLMGLLYMVAGAVGARIWCELLIVLFKMNEALQEIRRK